jgi:hypothetical protein
MVALADDKDEVVADVEAPHAGDGEDADRARLIAQAPAMARLLLKLGGHGVYAVNDDGLRVCRECEAWEHAVREPVHEPHCKLAAFLRAAGVLPPAL